VNSIGFKPKDGPPEALREGRGDFRKKPRSNATHQSTTDPEARLYRKSEAAPAQLCYIVYTL
jgi:hypothetical protein